MAGGAGAVDLSQQTRADPHPEPAILDHRPCLRLRRQGFYAGGCAAPPQLTTGYEKLKTKCREVGTTVGSGRVITMPVITEDGQPIEDPNSNGEQQTNNGPLPKEVIQWKLLLHQIGLENQTDRTLTYYESQENLARDILTVYAWVDTGIGYCQDQVFLHIWINY
ncbi:hypothetical protein TRIUR3_15590 [Triticum urartu]|uniref:Uncharacterized protein n=1 Tax=Triticum urartu TaxID=4572 RepID=M7Z3H5_TRIUA|nr:hypothetical protein TRIUR3_15590 [Triticum urartu]